MFGYNAAHIREFRGITPPPKKRWQRIPPSGVLSATTVRALVPGRFGQKKLKQ